MRPWNTFSGFINLCYLGRSWEMLPPRWKELLFSVRP